MRRPTRILAAIGMLGATVAVAVVSAPDAVAAADASTIYLLSPARLETGSCVDLRSDGSVAMSGCSLGGWNSRQLIQIVRQGASDMWLVGASGGKCIMVDGSSTETGAALVQAGCGNLTAKRWKIEWADELTVRFRNHNSGLCLAPGFGWLRPPMQSGCDSLRAEWFLTPVGGHYNIRARHSDKCLDVDTFRDGGMADGTLVQQWTCLGPGQNNQIWILELIALPQWESAGAPPNVDEWVRPAWYELHPRHNQTMCLNHNNRSENGYRPRQEACKAWTVTSRGWDYRPLDYTPESQFFNLVAHSSTHKCLDVRNDNAGGYADGTPVQIYTCLDPGQWNQVWRLVAA
jgi:hypothetical protein